MSIHLDRVPLSGIVRIRDMMYEVREPFRLDQGDVSFDAPPPVQRAIAAALADGQTHYAQTNGLPQLLDLLAQKLREQNRIPVRDPREVLVTNGGIHALYLVWQALLEPDAEVIIPDPEWPPCLGGILAARGRPIACPLHESLGWRYDLDELESLITPRTVALYVNSPHNPTGGVLPHADLERLAALATDRNLWVIADEAYEDILYDGAEHVSIGSLQGMYDRTVSVYTFSKTYAMTGLRLGYAVVPEAGLRDRVSKVLFQTSSNVSTIIQHGGIGALQSGGTSVAAFQRELDARRRLFYEGVRELPGGVFDGTAPAGAFYAFLRINPAWDGLPAGPSEAQLHDSISWRMAEFLISRARVGCVPGVDFGACGEGYMRFCFARSRDELLGALASMRSVFEQTP